MKILLVLSAFFYFTYAMELSEFIDENSYEVNYIKALKKAKDEKKNLMFVVVDKGCPWCTKLEENTLSNKVVNIEIKKDNIASIMQRNQDDFPKGYDAEFIPYIYFINPINEEIIYESIGYKAPEDFLAELKEARF